MEARKPMKSKKRSYQPINIEQALRLKFSLMLTASKPDDKHHTQTGFTVQLTI